MAKHQESTVLIPAGFVCWIPSNNYRSAKNYDTHEGRDTDKTRDSLAMHEWNADNSIPATAVTEEELAKEMPRREAEWERLKTSNLPEDLPAKEVFEQIYVKNGKLIKPEFSANAGFRRGSLYFAAMVQRYKSRSKPGNADLQLKYLIPIRPTVYGDEAERIYDQQIENELQGVGTVKMDDLDKLAVAKRLFDLGMKEVAIRRLYPSSTGQKLYSLCKAEKYWPELKIFDRLTKLPPNDPNFIKWGPIRHNEISPIVKHWEAVLKQKEGHPLTKDDRDLLNSGPINAETVNEWFKSLSAKEREPQMMKRNEIVSMSDNHPLKVAEKIASSVRYANTMNLKPLIEHKLALNGVVELIEGGNGNTADEVVEATKKDANLLRQVAQIVADGKGDLLRAAVDKILNPPVETVVPPTVPVPPTVKDVVDNNGNKTGKKTTEKVAAK